MARHIIVWDNVTNRYVNTGVPVGGGGGGGFTDEDFDVGGGGQTLFQLAADIDGSQTIDVFINGRLQREGGSFDYTRDATNDRINTTFTVPENAWVRVRIHD